MSSYDLILTLVILVSLGFISYGLKSKPKSAKPSPTLTTSPYQTEPSSSASHVAKEPGGETPPEAPVPPPTYPHPPLSKTGTTSGDWLSRLKKGLSRTQKQFSLGMEKIFLSDRVAKKEEVRNQLFETLIAADVGVTTSEKILDRCENLLSVTDWEEWDLVKKAVAKASLEILRLVPIKLDPLRLKETLEKPFVVMMVGVNGVGKTTTVGKLAQKAFLSHKKTVVGAGDTFRAAAVDQLRVWADRSQSTLVELNEKGDPASVAYESYKKAVELGAHLCLVDTAGRLHNRADLMQELAKIKRVLAKADPNAPHEILLVLDATTGQNGITQAKMFSQVVDVSGIVLTKLDGTAKGGVVMAIAHELGLPIIYAGVGEGVEDLEPFQAEQFVEALFGA
jgi:fused signal recognition particle receptor